ncbi:MAG: hypothetical protein H7176_01145 [Bdellovibrionales bacterium]|nr:hypothetical protein [Massilia sp.]
MLVTWLVASVAIAAPACVALTPLNAAAEAAPATYDCAFTGYQKYGEPTVAD